ncbi:MAG TPA: septum formation initiator family protein [Tessaracoccus flavescens]|uniref:Septum formation initiator family protein n=1 Tax=Tessaracoccus flavescens TaxID=399497 RepID=A0A921EPS3_9ACTN|nr:septum formation initiator family protein [Tessaracoccus flavescens]
MAEDEVSEVIDPKPSPQPLASRALSTTWRALVLIVVMAGLALVLANSLRVYLAQAQEISALRADITAQNERIAELQDKLTRWDDPAYVRSVARVRLGWVMPGEVGYRVIGADGQPLEGGVMVTDEDAAQPDYWWDKMWLSVKTADAPAPVETEKPEDTRVIKEEPADQEEDG